jgi:hypothetical protein
MGIRAVACWSFIVASPIVEWTFDAAAPGEVPGSASRARLGALSAWDG